MTDRKQPGVAFWATVAVVVGLVAYPLSFGPACWVSSYLDDSGEIVSLIYRPIIWYWVYEAGDSLDGIIGWYVGLGTKNGYYDLPHLVPPPRIEF
jgi:hypothetical protein